MSRTLFIPDLAAALSFRVCFNDPTKGCDVKGAPAPLSALNVDPMDGANATAGLLGVANFASPEQQALLGCGPFYQTSCDSDGLSLYYSEASMLLSVFHSDDVCDRSIGSAPTELPGCRGPASIGYDPNQDGSVAGIVNPLTGTPLASESQALAWNFAELLATLGAGFGPDWLDRGDPLAATTCSLANPGACAMHRDLLAASTRELDDDPGGLPRRRWLWESGAEFTITSASGSLAPFLGWTLYAFGPEVSRASGGSIGVPFLLVPPANTVVAPPSPFIVISDGIPVPGDETIQGMAYGVVTTPRQPSPTCGIGPEILLLAPLWLSLRSRRRFL
jgi:hypothetical protein